MSQFAHKTDNWAAMGDFNVIRYPFEKISNTPPILSELFYFSSCLQASGLDDMNGSGCDFTWFNKQEIATRVYSKLDRVLVNDSWLHHFSQTTTHFLSPGTYDHSPALLTFHDNDSPKKHFKFLNCWTEYPDFKRIITDCWRTSQVGNSMFKLMSKLKKVKQRLKNLHASHFANISNRVKDKRAELSQCYQSLQASPTSDY
ncbi:uncharacterized protein LOC141601024 [Silene latifolia]|uniref:uncharacterized protein LOC141601024 n=1 Tax=Silene latifolia TaxID=37657 RepID=UPI003D78AFB6